MITDSDKVRALRIICGVSSLMCKDAVNYCKEHPDCNEVGYVMAQSFAVYWKKGMDDKIKHFSEYAKDHICYIYYQEFLKTGIIPKGD